MKKLIKIYLILCVSIFCLTLYCFNDFLFYNPLVLSCSRTQLDNDNPYIKNPLKSNYLYVISEDHMTRSEQTMIATLQGLICDKSLSQIYITTCNEPDYEIWLKDVKKNYNVKYEIVKDPWLLIKKFKPYVNGYVLYDSSNFPSINNACTLASLKNSIAIDKSIENLVNSQGITNLIKDCSNTNKYWGYNNLWDLGLNHSTVIELSPDKTMALRDYAILSKSLIFYEDNKDDLLLRNSIFSSMNDNGHCLGWGPDEHKNVELASNFGIDVIASDWSYNLSVLSFYDNLLLKQKTNDCLNEDGFHYVTFIMSDGDNQRWLLGSNYGSKNYFGSPYRGRFNLGWSISPSLYYLAPTVFNKYYKSASCYDNFVVAPSGNGYMYPSKFPSKKLDSYTEILNNYMEKVDESYVLILDDDSFYNTNLWDKYTSKSNIDGLLYLNYERNNSYDGKIIWSNNKPIVSCRDLLWAGLEDEDTLIKNINDRVNLGYADIKNPNSYTFVYVHVWSNTMDNVYDVVNKLNKNPKVKIVTPNTFMNLIKTNISPI